MEAKKDPEGSWFIAGAIVVAGIFVAVAVFLSRSHGAGELGPTSEVVVPPMPTGPSPVFQTPAAPSTVSVPLSSDPDEAAAQKSLIDTLQAAAAIYSANGSYMAATSLELLKVEPGLTFEPPTRASTGPTDVSISVAVYTFTAAALAESGACFYARDTVGMGTAYGTGSVCTGSAALSASEPSWPQASLVEVPSGSPSGSLSGSSASP